MALSSMPFNTYMGNTGLSRTESSMRLLIRSYWLGMDLSQAIGIRLAMTLLCLFKVDHMFE